MSSKKKMISFYPSTASPDDFVGARIYEKKIDFFFPVGFKYAADDEKSCRMDAFDILSAIIAASPSRKMRNFSESFDSLSNEPFDSYIWILNDCLKNGLYNLREKSYVNSFQGRINWKRTLQEIPFIREGSFIYLKPVAERYLSSDDVITIIHKYCLSVSLEKAGWLFSFYNDDNLFRQISPQLIIYYKNVLLKELGRTFEDRKKLLLMHLLRVLDGSVGGDYYKDRFEIGTYKFSFVWENMIRQIYGNLPLEKFFPNAFWCIGNTPPVASTHLRPDTVMSVNQKLYVLDAKYYKYGVFQNGVTFLPNSDSIQKQVTYGDHAALKFSDSFPNGIKNAFIIPFSSDDDLKMKYVGYAVPGWRDDEETTHRKVHLVMLDTRYLIELYRRKNHDNVLRYNLAKIIDDGLV